MPSIDLDLHLTISLWWLIAYLTIGLVVGFVTYAAARMRLAPRDRMPRLDRFAIAMGIWMVGWPVCVIILIKDEIESRRAIANWNARDRTYDYD